VMPMVQKHMIYAYDAYMIYCAKSFRIPLLTLDNGMAAVAEKEKVKVLEV
jgi:predicted nucleic acid-binding protein